MGIKIIEKIEKKPKKQQNIKVKKVVESGMKLSNSLSICETPQAEKGLTRKVKM